MVAFEVKVNQKLLCTAGVGDFGVLSAVLSWVSVNHGHGQNDKGRGEQDEETFFTVGGLRSEEHLRWIDHKLVETGDEIVIRIVNVPKCDQPRVVPEDGYYDP
jgi:hypothetical protein